MAEVEHLNDVYDEALHDRSVDRPPPSATPLSHATASLVSHSAALTPAVFAHSRIRVIGRSREIAGARAVPAFERGREFESRAAHRAWSRRNNPTRRLSK